MLESLTLSYQSNNYGGLWNADVSKTPSLTSLRISSPWWSCHLIGLEACTALRTLILDTTPIEELPCRHLASTLIALAFGVLSNELVDGGLLQLTRLRSLQVLSASLDDNHLEKMRSTLTRLVDFLVTSESTYLVIESMRRIRCICRLFSMAYTNEKDIKPGEVLRGPVRPRFHKRMQTDGVWREQRGWGGVGKEC